jgi:hypothetical protein
LVACCAVAIAACGGGGGGGGYTPPGGGTAPTATPTGSAVDACLQTPNPGAPSGLSNQAPTFFTSTLPNAHQVCLSLWEFSSDLDTALSSAVSNGGNVSVIVPYSERNSGSNASDASSLEAAGGHIIYEDTSAPHASPWPRNVTYMSSPMDIHAKFALVDGIAYMDGHNWFSTDVVMEDGQSGDYAVVQSVLTAFPTPAPSNGTFTTDKQASLANESAYVTAENPQSGQEYDFISEDFNPTGTSPNNNGAVYHAMCQAAANGATVKVVVEDYSGDTSSAQAALTNLLLLDPNASVRSNSGGLEKISMVRGTGEAWFGSSNDTTTDLFDWGMDITDSGIISALQSYYDSTYGASSPIPSPSPGATASPCP